MMSHPFQGGVGDRDESSFPRGGGGPSKIFALLHFSASMAI